MTEIDDIIIKYRPSKEELEREIRKAESLIKKIEEYFNGNNIKGKAELVGSLSRGTSLKNSDMDIFLIFPREIYSKREMEKIGLDTGFSLLEKPVSKFAEHPYVSGYFRETKVDIVPCFEIKPGERIISSVDRTPLHSKYLKERMNDEMRNEAIKLKLFLKGQSIYGSELKTGGFSGYVSELLITMFGTFESFIKYCSSLKGRMVLNNIEKFDSPVVLIDPVDATRNAAAAVTEHSLSVLKMAARAYVDQPSPLFFDYELIKNKKEKCRERDTFIIIFKMKRPELVDDIIYPQLHLSLKSLKTFSEINELPFLDGEVYADENNVSILMEFLSRNISSVKMHWGPEVDNENALKFYKKYIGNPSVLRGPYINKQRLVVDLKVEETDILNIIKSKISDLNFGKNLNSMKNSGEFIFENEKVKIEQVYKKYCERIEPFIPRKKPQ
ncbi:CCA tRNA nucleotidyltransferase [Caldiplasma sukawensis]